MKRVDLLRRLYQHGCELLREGDVNKTSITIHRVNRMNHRSLLVGTAALLVGLLCGVGATNWYHAKQWSETFVELNMVPTMADETNVLKYLRQGKHAEIQAILEEVLWKQISLHAQRRAEGKPLSEIAKRDIDYLCSYNVAHPTSYDSSVVNQRNDWCSAL